MRLTMPPRRATFFSSYECTYCERTFTQSNQLKTHIASQQYVSRPHLYLLHTADVPHFHSEHDKPYKCKYDDCDKGFNDPSLRTRHYVRDHDAPTKSRTVTTRRPRREVTRPAASTTNDNNVVKFESIDTSKLDSIPFALEGSPSLIGGVSSLDAFFDESIRSSLSAPCPPIETFDAADTSLPHIPTLGYPSDLLPQSELEFNNAALPPLWPATSQAFSPQTFSFPQQSVPLNAFPDPQSTFPLYPSFPATSYGLSQPVFGTMPDFERMYGQTQVPLVQPFPTSDFPVWYPMASLYPQAREPTLFGSAGPLDGSMSYLCRSQDNGSSRQETRNFSTTFNPALIFDQSFNGPTDAQTAYPSTYPSQWTRFSKPN